MFIAIIKKNCYIFKCNYLWYFDPHICIHCVFVLLNEIWYFDFFAGRRIIIRESDIFKTILHFRLIGNIQQ